MKKVFSLFILFFSSFLFAQTFHINIVNYNIEGNKSFSLGKTNVYALEQNVPLDKETIFASQTDFEEYLKEYVQKLNNTRTFETIEIEWSLNEVLSTPSCSEIILNVNLHDSFHLLALPHLISYNSNDGWKPKLKAKDSNFLGSLNTMSADFYSIIPILSDNKNTEIGAELSFILPFKASIFDVEWINDYTFSYDFSRPTPEWDAQTGFIVTLPFNKYKIQLELSQYAFRDYEYLDFNDITYFKEEAKLSVPLKLFEITEWGDFIYTPYTQIYYNWDKDGINIQNNNLSSPTLSAGHKIETSNINWFGNYRKGLSFKLENKYLYYFQRNDFIPCLSFDAKLYYYFTLFDSDYFNKIGINSHIYYFSYFNQSNYYYGEKIGSYLRGIRDDQYYASTSSYPNEKALNTSNATILNLDFPYHLFTTHFSNKIMSYFNCDAQIAPFLDIALCNNRVSGKNFSLKDGFYAGGIEMLVYPKKWSSFTVRGSLGLDLGRYLFSNSLNMNWRTNVSKYEISIGLGLHY